MGGVDNRFRIGRWKISSQSLDGQKLETSHWIMPKVTPKGETLPPLKKSSRFLDTFQLENPSQRMQDLQGRRSKPIPSNVWLPKTNRANISPIFDGTAESSELVYTVAQKRISDNEEEDDTSRVVVINKGTGVQVIVLPENEDNQKLIQSLVKSKNAIIIRKEEKQEENHNILADKSILREVLDDLTHKGNVKKLNLLRESLQHKTEVYQTDEINKENKKLTNVGISL